MSQTRDYTSAVPATTGLVPRMEQVSAPASLGHRVEFPRWVPPEHDFTWEHEVVPDANVDLMLELAFHCS